MTADTPENAPATPPPPAPSLTVTSGQDSHLFDRVAVLYKYRWASITVFTLVVGWLMVDSYSQVPIYRATAQVLIEDPNSDIATPTEIARSVAVSDMEIYTQTQLRIMRGRDLASRVAADLNLDNVPEFNGQGPKPTPLAATIATIKRYAAVPYRMITTASGPSAVMPKPSGEPGDHTDALLSRLSVEPVRGSQLVDLSFVSADPEFAARAVNAFADRYVEENLSAKVSTLEKSAEWLTGEVKKQAELVQKNELDLARYKETQDAASLDSNQNIIVSRLNQSSDQLIRARTERITKEGLWRQVQAAGEDVSALSAIINNQQVQLLRSSLNQLEQDRARITERYGPRHPDYQKINSQYELAKAQLDTEVNKAKQTIRTEYEQAVLQEQQFQNQVNDAKAAATALGRKGVDYAVMLRETESNRAILNQLLTREKELRVVANSRANNVRVVDRAEVPAAPYTPNHRNDWTYALIMGLFLGIGIALGLDYLDDTVKTPDDISRRLKLRFLGLVPIVSGDRHPLISGPVPHEFGEAYRAIRTSLTAHVDKQGPKIITTASSQPLEGKTTTAVNIAMALAVGGARVLLIDADMRRPSVHKALRMGNDRGLSQLLAGQARMREVVQRTHDPNLLAITAGRTPANPSELLASDRMRALLTGLETGPFDWVVIDTPPVLAVTDAVILAPLVDAVAFVIGSEMTRWRLAERAVETLLGSNPRRVMAILNKVNYGRNKYYYSRYYGHQYKNYYAESPAA
ncbi:MAG TPA: polysaccharide biosynthesis tyrosine autokinase [Vicinamibacterales bacterium]|nr:polysaccharide biosynthesis tyrosine autokinase [Vicinamibacterales bacterium]